MTDLLSFQLYKKVDGEGNRQDGETKGDEVSGSLDLLVSISAPSMGNWRSAASEIALHWWVVAAMLALVSML